MVKAFRVLAQEKNKKLRTNEIWGSKFNSDKLKSTLFPPFCVFWLFGNQGRPCFFYSETDSSSPAPMCCDWLVFLLPEDFASSLNSHIFHLFRSGLLQISQMQSDPKDLAGIVMPKTSIIALQLSQYKQMGGGSFLCLNASLELIIAWFGLKAWCVSRGLDRPFDFSYRQWALASDSTVVVASAAGWD